MPKECISAGSSRFANCNYKKIRYRRRCAMDCLAWGKIKMKNVTRNCAQRQWHMIKWFKSYIKKNVSTNNQMMSIPLFICILCVVWEQVKKLNLNCMPGHAQIIFSLNKKWAISAEPQPVINFKFEPPLQEILLPPWFPWSPNNCCRAWAYSVRNFWWRNIRDTAIFI